MEETTVRLEIENYVSIFVFFIGVLIAIKFHNLFIAVLVLLIFGIIAAAISFPDAVAIFLAGVGYFIYYGFILFIIYVVIFVILGFISFDPNLDILAFFGQSSSFLVGLGFVAALSVILTVLKLSDVDFEPVKIFFRYLLIFYLANSVITGILILVFFPHLLIYFLSHIDDALADFISVVAPSIFMTVRRVGREDYASDEGYSSANFYYEDAGFDYEDAGKTWEGGTDEQVAQPEKGNLDWAYSLLGINAGASDEEVRRAYYEAAKTYHPDATHKDTNEKMKLINDAYEKIKEDRRIGS